MKSFITSRLTELKNKSEKPKISTASQIAEDHVQERWGQTYD